MNNTLVIIFVICASATCNDLIDYPSDIVEMGYEFESSEVTTQDGYIIDLHHFSSPQQTKQRKVLLMVHGVTQSARSFFQNDAGINHSLGYYYLVRNYDLWFFNARGNLYSRKHKTIGIDSTEFWAYDWNEVGLYDLSTTIDFIRNTTDQDKINVICFSLGCSELFILLSESDEYNDRIDQVHAMAPSVYLNVFAKQFLGNILKNYLMAASHYIDIFGDRETTTFVSYVYNRLCLKPGQDHLNPRCVNGILKMIEYAIPNVYNRFKFYLRPDPTGSPIKFLTHFLQISESKKLQKYDFGALRNLFIYKRTTPPVYNLTRIRAPVYLYNTNNDELLDSDYFAILRDTLPNVKRSYVIDMKGFQHNGFIRHKYAGIIVYKLINYYLNL